MERAETLDEFLDREPQILGGDAVEVHDLGLRVAEGAVLLRPDVLLVLDGLDCGREGVDHVFRLVLRLLLGGEEGIEGFIGGRGRNGGGD